jgi:hypothetical protein
MYGVDAMKKANSMPKSISILIAVPLLFLGCTSDQDSRGSAGGSQDAAPVSDAPAEADVDPTIAEICPGACETVRECEPTTDIAACEAQCAVELQGGGYLIPYVARQVFTAIRDTTTRQCAYVFGQAAFDEVMAQPFANDVDVLDSCRNRRADCFQVDPFVATEICVIDYFRYNTPIREKIAPCFSPELKCGDIDGCAHAKAPEDPLWIAGAPYPPGWPTGN